MNKKLIPAAVGKVVLILFGAFCWAQPIHASEAAGVWQSLQQNGHVALLRHAIAPGTGDPPEFTLRDCTTQRNLSATGRRQAAAIGERFRENGIPVAQIFSSQWCRCLETARLLELGPVLELPLLNSFFRHFERRERQTTELKAWLAAQDLTRPTVLVTHQVNITALTGVYPASGELVVIEVGERGEIRVVGTLEPD
ncbi:MAG TPA: histidine phosphatase family protein [Desulfuromonadales bacterium]|nr:histidine phosphatase family protein [Desulfuromonadales bacterium]